LFTLSHNSRLLSAADIGATLTAISRGGGDQQREEHVVLSFKSEDAVSAQRRKLACVARRLAR
jgi:hypothetical protein